MSRKVIGSVIRFVIVTFNAGAAPIVTEASLSSTQSLRPKGLLKWTVGKPLQATAQHETSKSVQSTRQGLRTGVARGNLQGGRKAKE